MHPTIGKELIQNSKEGIGLGSVHVYITITNPFDLSEARGGFRQKSEVRSMEVQALVDTGAVRCVLPAAIADAMGLVRSYRQLATYADGRSEVVDVTEPVLMEIMGRRTYEDCMVLGDEVLIGQTALGKTNLFVDCKAQELVPHPDHPNFAVIRV